MAFLSSTNKKSSIYRFQSIFNFEGLRYNLRYNLIWVSFLSLSLFACQSSPPVQSNNSTKISTHKPLVQNTDQKIHRAVSHEFPQALISEIKHLKNGSFQSFVKWDEDPFSSNPDVLSGNISWYASSNSEYCKNLSFIQIARVLDNNQQDYEWKMDQADRNAFKTQIQEKKLSIQPGFYVDIDAKKCKKNTPPCSPYYHSHFGPPLTGSKSGSHEKDNVTPAILIDFPFGWSQIESIELEACVVCEQTRAAAAAIQGCVKWGAKWPIQEHRTLFPLTTSDQPSDTFVDALNRFNDFYQNPTP